MKSASDSFTVSPDRRKRADLFTLDSSDLFVAMNHGRGQMEAHLIKQQSADGLFVLIPAREEKVVHIPIHRVPSL